MRRTDPRVAAIYPDGIHQALAGYLAARIAAATATLDEPEHGLSEPVLGKTDVLIWWGHMAHGEVSDAIVDRVQRRVLEGMGLVVLHSGHFSKIFKRLMGTSCDLKWREANERSACGSWRPAIPSSRVWASISSCPRGDVRRVLRHPRRTSCAPQLVPGRRGLPQRLLLPPRAGQDLLFPPRPRDVSHLSQPGGAAGDRQRRALGGAGGPPAVTFGHRPKPLEPLPD